MADLHRAWLLRQLGLTSSTLTEADLEASLYGGGFSGNGVSTNRGFSSGKYYSSGGPAALSVNALSLNGLYLLPFEVGEAANFDRIACEVTTAGGAGSVIRLGIYDTDTNGMPNNLVLEAAGTVDANVVAAAELNIAAALKTGLYWTALVCQVAAASVRSQGVHQSPFIGQSALPAAGSAHGSYRVAGVAGALPATAVGAVSNAVPPLVYLRAA